MINWNLLQQQLPNTTEVTKALNLLQQVEERFCNVEYDHVVQVASVITNELTRDIFVDLVLDAIERLNPMYDEIIKELLEDVMTNSDKPLNVKQEDVANWLRSLED